MFIIALFGAFLLYVVLYFFYERAGSSINTPPPFLVSLRDMVFSTPNSTPLALLKWGLILFAFYLVGDGILSFLKRSRKGK